MDVLFPAAEPPSLWEILMNLFKSTSVALSLKKINILFKKIGSNGTFVARHKVNKDSITIERTIIDLCCMQLYTHRQLCTYKFNDVFYTFCRFYVDFPYIFTQWPIVVLLLLLLEYVRMHRECRK